MISKEAFREEVYRLHRAFSKPVPKPESEAAWWREFPKQYTAEDLGSAVSSILREYDRFPDNVVRALQAGASRAMSERRREVETAETWESTPADAALNRNRVQRLMGIVGDKGHPSRSKILTIANSPEALRAPDLAGRHICDIIDHSIASTHPEGAMEEAPF